MTPREQAARLLEQADVTDELIEAKEAYRKAPTDKNRERMAAAKADARAFAAARPAPPEGDGVAAPSTIKTKAK